MSARLIAAVALTVTTAAAQEPAPALQVPEPPEPPAGANAWSLRINTSGGFTGMGVGSVTISSDGQMSCGPAPCATPVAATLLNPVATSIAASLEAAWIRQTPSGACMDCIRTTVALKRRDGDVVRVFRASWDDSRPPSPELRELRRVAFELRAARSAR
jgi:hypothetical protein